ncbi:DUF4349 domain-containing protein [Streptomyces sp. 6N223]|uniref:DUF4349 domain-containing protein n=1 Tax=Streptomyces sp. 6N223 TaxID=3457412 RepID=UPI003FD4F72F
MKEPVMAAAARRRGARATALLAFPLALLLALTACGRSGDGDGGGASADSAQVEGGEAAREEAAQGAADASGQGADAGAAADRADSPRLAPEHRIITARLTVLTDDVAGRYAEAVSLAEASGGYVSEESTDRDSRGRERSTVTLRVPQDRYEELLSELSDLGELSGREVTTEDVTDQVVDVESRIATQQESVDRVRSLMEDAVSIDDIVILEGELSTRQSDLEALQSQQESLRGQTAMATVTLQLREPDAEPRGGEEDDDSSAPSIGAALSGGWGAFVTTLAWSGAVVVAVLPFAAALALLALAGWACRRRWPARAGSDEPAPSTE